MSAPFATKILTVAPIPPGFTVRVTHSERFPDEAPKVVERHDFPVIGWATVQDDRERTSVEAMFLWDGDPITTSDYRSVWSDLEPDPGEPKQTVGVKVIHPEEQQ